MERYAFRMQLLPGMVEEYRRRHQAIWPDLADLMAVMPDRAPLAVPLIRVFQLD